MCSHERCALFGQLVAHHHSELGKELFEWNVRDLAPLLHGIPYLVVGDLVKFFETGNGVSVFPLPAPFPVLSLFACLLAPYAVPNVPCVMYECSGSFLDPNSPVVKDTLWAMSYSVVFGLLGGGVVIAGLLFVPLQLLCKVFSKNVPEYSWMDRALTRAMLFFNLVFILSLTIVGLWSTSAFYFNIVGPVSELHDQAWVLKQKYEVYYENAALLKANTPSYDIYPAEPINQMEYLLSNGTGNLEEVVTFAQKWAIRGAFGGFVPYAMPLIAVIFSFVYILKGRRLMYTVALIITLISLFCMMGVAIPNSAWAVLVSSQCTAGIHSNMVRYLEFYNPGTCVPEVVRSYVWNDPITRSACLPDPWNSTQAKIDAASATAPKGNAAFYLTKAKAAWAVMSDIERTNELYNTVLDKGCGATANRGATLFLVTLFLWVYLLLHVYILLFSTMRLKKFSTGTGSENYKHMAEEAPTEQQLDTFKSNIRERIRRDQFDLDNSNVLWTLIGWGIIQMLALLFLSIGFGVGAQKILIADQ